MKSRLVVIIGIIFGLISWFVAEQIKDISQSSDFIVGGGNTVGLPLTIYWNNASMGPRYWGYQDFSFINLAVDVIVWVVPAIFLVWLINKLLIKIKRASKATLKKQA
jgi:hypothetical protein